MRCRSANRIYISAHTDGGEVLLFCFGGGRVAVYRSKYQRTMVVILLLAAGLVLFACLTLAQLEALMLRFNWSLRLVVLPTRVQCLFLK